MEEENPYHSESMWKGAPPEGFSKAKTLRDRMTTVEPILWEHLRNKQFFGYKFRRQHPLHVFIVDFYCHSLKLVIDLDGAYHNAKEQKEKDLERERLIAFQGLRVIRFANEEIINNLQDVLSRLKLYIDDFR